MDEKEYWKYIRKRTWGKVKAFYGFNKNTRSDIIWGILGLVVVYGLDIIVRGISDAREEIWTFVIYLLLVGYVVFCGRYLRLSRTEPVLFHQEKQAAINDLEDKLEAKYNETDILVEEKIYDRTVNDQWVGLKVSNRENEGINQFNIALQSVINEDGEGCLTAPIMIDWSAVNPPSLDYKLPREDTKYFDVAFTRAVDYQVTFVLLQGGHRFNVGKGIYKLRFKLGGEINKHDIKPQNYSGILEYRGGLDLEIRDIKHERDEK